MSENSLTDPSIKKRSAKKPRYKNIWTYVITIAAIAGLICVAKLLLNTHIIETRDHYTAGILYNNPEDERIFVPRDDNLGWTLNFANGWSYLVVGMIILIALYSILRSLESDA